MKYHTQGQRFSGTWFNRAGVRYSALALAVVASGLGTYVLVVAPATRTATVEASAHVNLVSQSVATSASSRTTTSATGDRGRLTVSVATPTTTPRAAARHSSITRSTTPPPSPTTTTSVAVPAPAAQSHAVAQKPTATTATTPVRHAVGTTATATIPTSTVTRAVTRTVTRTVAPPKRTKPAPPVAPKPAVISGVAAAAAKLAAHLNPTFNIAPNPDFLQSGQCTQNGSTWSCANPCLTPSMTWPAVNNSASCSNYILQAIDNARAVENLGPMNLPSNWYSLTTGQQLFVVADLERTARGLPPYLGINAALSAAAQRAAATNQDPAVAGGFAIGLDDQGYPAMGGAWSGGYSVLAADYIWMYDDGWGGSVSATSNVACTSSHAAGCWAHRDELIGSDPGFNPGVGLTTSTVEVGVGFAVVNGSGSFVDLMEKPASTPPAMTFTWAANVAPYL